MNENILRGFCKKCEEGIKLIEINKHSDFYWQIVPSICLSVSILKENNVRPHEPIFFLSAKQIDMIFEYFYLHSGKFYDKKLNKFWLNEHPDISKLLNKEPFMIAKILQKVDGKNE